MVKVVRMEVPGGLIWLWACDKIFVWVKSLPPPPVPFTFPSPLPLLEVGCLKRAMRSRGALQAHQVGYGVEPQTKANLMHFSLTTWHLASTILLIFLTINWPQCRINEHTGQLLVEPKALWPTQTKSSVGHGPLAHAVGCSASHVVDEMSQEVDPEMRWCVSK